MWHASSHVHQSPLCLSSAVIVDGYTPTATLASGEAVPLGTVLTLICRVDGLPSDEPRTYTWTCPNGLCKVVYYDIAKMFEHILVVNTTSISDGGMYICQVTGGQQRARGSFTVTVTGRTVRHIGRVCHSSLGWVQFSRNTQIHAERWQGEMFGIEI